MTTPTKEEMFPDGIPPKTYSETLSELKKHLVTIHEYACASGDLLSSLERHTSDETGRIGTKSSEVNYAMIIALEGMLSFLAAAEENDEAILAASLLAYRENLKTNRRG